jgi:hypothetical protein
MTAAVEMLAATTMAMTATVVATTIRTMTTMPILRMLHRRNYSRTIIATATLCRQR